MNTSRRRLLAAGVGTAGAAYVAPQILATSVAGAMTETIYVFKLGLSGGCSTTGLAAGPTDTECDATFNAALAAATTGGTVIIGCPPAGLISSNLNVTSGDVTVGANCTLAFLGVGTSAGSCHPPGSAGDPVLIDADEKGGCYVLTGGETFEFLTVALRCVGSP